MEKIMTGNSVCLTGQVISEPVFNHKTYGEAFYMIILGIFRKSGYEDRVRLLVSDHLMGGRSPVKGEILRISGQIRTYNKETEGRSKLEITVFVREMEYCRESEAEYENRVILEGYLCKQPVRRTSPLGRELCDLMIAVNRMYNKSDYIPAIAWGRNAIYADTLHIGEKVAVDGRLQSREYRKYTERGELITKTAYEVSIARIETVSEW